MAYRSTHQARRTLADIAAGQGGYFTAKQAADAGYGRRHIVYHVKAGNFERVERGLFRLPTVALSAHDDLIRLSLWSRGRDDQPQAVVSHETALGVHEMGDLLPEWIHLTVPRSFRKRPPRVCRLHRANLLAHEVEQREGFRLTTPLRTVLDVAEGDAVTQDQLEVIVRQARAAGLLRASQIKAVVSGLPADSRLARVFGKGE
ncbi:MAG: type IV toxin-antitoxin system AbiEi family antitoxin domain-containing protein [Phycisphaerae bacterium]|jgi:predicted transcriptional regulator of viral defense system